MRQKVLLIKTVCVTNTVKKSLPCEKQGKNNKSYLYIYLRNGSIATSIPQNVNRFEFSMVLFSRFFSAKSTKRIIENKVALSKTKKGNRYKKIILSLPYCFSAISLLRYCILYLFLI